MNNWDRIGLHIEDDATGANEVDPNDWNGRVESVEDMLIDWVYEHFLDDGININAQPRIYNMVRRMIAVAMIAERDYCWRYFDEIIVSDEMGCAETQMEMLAERD